MIASIFCATMICLARSMRARRSSAVIGFTRPRIDVRAAMLGGSGPLASPPRPRCAEIRTTDRPAAAPVSHRNDRRVTMTVSSKTESKAAADAKAAGVHVQRVAERHAGMRKVGADAKADLRPQQVVEIATGVEPDVRLRLPRRCDA